MTQQTFYLCVMNDYETVATIYQVVHTCGSPNAAMEHIYAASGQWHRATSKYPASYFGEVPLLTLNIEGVVITELAGEYSVIEQVADDEIVK